MFFLGAVALLIGFFIAAPIAMIAATYAYEDIFGAAAAKVRKASAGVGPTGTVVMPNRAPSEGGAWKPSRQMIGVAAFLVIAAVLILIGIGKQRSRQRASHEFQDRLNEIVSKEFLKTPEDAAATEALQVRLEAASAISDPSAKTEAMSTLATDAAKLGEVETVKTALRNIIDFTRKNFIASESSKLLAQHGKRKQALEIAKSIGDPSLRDKALSDLAQ